MKIIGIIFFLLLFSQLNADVWDLATTPATFTVYGAHNYDELDVVTVGDVNGDGRNDLLLGAPGADTSASRQYGYGQVYLFYGGNLQGTKDLKTDSADFTVLGLKRDAYCLGKSLAIGDVNGDGKGDLILGTNACRVGGRSRGQVCVIFGGNLNGVWDLETRLPDYWILAPYYSLGVGEVASGDLNGDDIADIIFTCPFGRGPNQNRENAGDAYIISGARNLSGIRDLEIDSADVTIYGADPGDELGFSYTSMWPVIYCGDVNGDGIDDLLGSAWSGDGPGNARGSCGEVYLFYGGTLPRVWDLFDTPADLTMYGQRSGSGLSSCALGDISGDGYSDLLLANNAFSYQDTAYVFYGDSNSLRGIKDLASDTADLLILGMREYNDFMGTVNLADVNQDGRLDLLLAATYGDGPGNSRSGCGDVYLLWGGNLRGVRDLSLNPPDWTFFGKTVDYHLGTRLTGGDVTGSTHAEVILSGGLSWSGPSNDPRIDGGDIHVIDLGPHISVDEANMPKWPTNQLLVSPNPAKDLPTIFYSLKNKTKISLKLYDVSGRLVQILAKGFVEPGSHTIDIVKGLASGVYFLELDANNNKITKKIIVLE